MTYLTLKFAISSRNTFTYRGEWESGLSDNRPRKCDWEYVHLMETSTYLDNSLDAAARFFQDSHDILATLRGLVANATFDELS